ncbi:F-box domain-containing protein [Pleurotus pulmonarius]
MAADVPTKSPITFSQLPVELIAEIFVLAQGSDNGFPAWTPCRPSDWKQRTWLNVAGVSRRWRQIALETPQLWATLDLTSSASGMEMIERSKGAPLRVRCCRPFKYSLHKSIGEAIIRQFSRIEELNISGATQDMKQLFEEALPSTTYASLPVLRTLRMSSKLDCTGLPSLPRLIASSHLPALHLIELHNFKLDLPLLPLPRLVRLHLSSQSDSNAISWDILFHSLRNMPNLEDLTLFYVALDAPDPDTSSTSVELSSLRTLNIKFKDLASFSVLDYLKYPPSTKVTFICAACVITSIPNLSGLRHLFSQLCQDDAPAVREVRVHSGGAPPRYLSIAAYAANAAPVRNVVLNCYDPTSHLAEICVQLCSALPRQHLETLRLDGLEGLPRSAWPRLLQNMDAITRVEASYIAPPFICALSRQTHTNEAPPLPKLRTLVLSYCEFEDPCFDPGCGEMIPTLMNVLQERKELGMVIQDLKLQQCQIGANKVAELKVHTVTKVHWDGTGSSVT